MKFFSLMIDLHLNLQNSWFITTCIFIRTYLSSQIVRTIILYKYMAKSVSVLFLNDKIGENKPVTPIYLGKLTRNNDNLRALLKGVNIFKISALPDPK